MGQTEARRHRRWDRAPRFPAEPDRRTDSTDLGAALERLPHSHRVAVLLVYSHGYSYEEAAALIGIKVSTLHNHLVRGMRRLRRELGTDERRHDHG